MIHGVHPTGALAAERVHWPDGAWNAPYDYREGEPSAEPFPSDATSAQQKFRSLVAGATGLAMWFNGAHSAPYRVALDSMLVHGRLRRFWICASQGGGSAGHDRGRHDGGVVIGGRGCEGRVGREIIADEHQRFFDHVRLQQE